VISRLRQEGAFTLIELLLASSLMIVVLAATLTVFDQFVTVSHRNTDQNDAQDTARNAIDQLARQLRNLALPTLQNPNSIDKASSYDVVFKTADPGRRRVRYCLQTSSPYSQSSGALWFQTQQVTTVGATDPPPPPTDVCPATGWDSTRLVAARVTNQLNNANRPIFQFNGPTVTPSKITEVHAAVFVDVDPLRPPAEARISTGVYLRNQNQAPAASFTISGVSSRHFIMNAADSSDPEGRTLAYYWFTGASPSFTNAQTNGQCNSADGCILSGVLNDYTVPASAGTGPQTFWLLVKDPGGLTATASATCNVTGNNLCSAPH
jgi:type II secretory pathway pseudopilin PulG